MKASLLALTLLTLSTVSIAREQMYADTVAATTTNEKDMKIANLNKLLDQQQRLYEEKVSYLEAELKKSKDRLIEKSINHDRMQATVEKRFHEESSFLKKELVAKTKTLMEYQRQLEKVNPSEEMKNLIKVNTELTLELRASTDNLAQLQAQTNQAALLAKKEAPRSGRMPASAEEK